MAQYEIIIKNQTKEKGGAAGVAETPSGNGRDKKKNADAKPIISGAALYSAAKRMTWQAVAHNTEMISIRTAQSERQQMRQFQTGVTERMLSALEAVAVGAAAGGLAGAVAGLGLSFASSVQSYAYQLDALSASKAAEDVSRGMALTRAGTLDSRRGTE